MNTFLMLVRREFWEQKVSFLYLPIAILVLSVVLIVTGLIKAESNGLDQLYYQNSGQQIDQEDATTDLANLFILNGIEEFATLPEERQEYFFDGLFFASSGPLGLTLWFCLLSYFMVSLYQERKDRSILFWKSMPISDTQTVASKLAAGLVLAPMIYLACSVILHIIIAFCISIIALDANVGIWSTIWAPANLISRWFEMAFFWVLISLWTLPLFGWLIFCSSWVRSIPLAWSLGIPLSLILIEAALTITNTGVLRTFISSHSNPLGVMKNPGQFNLDLGAIMSNFTSLEFIISTALGLGFIYAAIYFRGKADEL